MATRWVLLLLCLYVARIISTSAPETKIHLGGDVVPVAVVHGPPEPARQNDRERRPAPRPSPLACADHPRAPEFGAQRAVGDRDRRLGDARRGEHRRTHLPLM